MMTVVDITGKRSECVDTEYACVYAAPPRVLGSMLVLEFWGLLLRTHGKVDFLIPGLPFSSQEHSVFIASWAQMHFDKPVSLEFTVALYDEAGTSFRRDSSGDVICLESSVTQHVSGTPYTYDVGGHLLWPNGDAQVCVRATGVVTLEFLTESCMTAREFERRKGGIVFPS